MFIQNPAVPTIFHTFWTKHQADSTSDVSDAEKKELDADWSEVLKGGGWHYNPLAPKI